MSDDLLALNGQVSLLLSYRNWRRPSIKLTEHSLRRFAVVKLFWRNEFNFMAAKTAILHRNEACNEL